MNMILWILIALLALLILGFGSFWLFMGPQRPGTRVAPESGHGNRAKDDIWEAVSRRNRDYR